MPAKSYNSSHTPHKIFNAIIINFLYAISVMSEVLKAKAKKDFSLTARNDKNWILAF